MIIRITAVLAVLFLILSAGCISTDTSMEKAAEKTVANIAEELEIMGNEMYKAGDAVLAADGEANAAEAALKELYENTDYSISILCANGDEICIAGYPEFIQSSVGNDLTSYGTGEAFYKGRDIVLKEYQLLEGDFYSSILSIPLYKDGKFAGFISDALDIAKLVKEIEAELQEEFGYSLWIAEPSGMQIYDSDVEEVGLNILEDNLYADPAVHAVCEKICSEPEGTASYTFVENGVEVTKTACWKTMSFGGQDWRVGVTTLQ